MKGFLSIVLCLVLLNLDPTLGRRRGGGGQRFRGGGGGGFFRSLRPFFDGLNQFEFFEASGEDDTCEEEPVTIAGRDEETDVNEDDEGQIAQFISRTAASQICLEADVGERKCICYKSRLSFRCRSNYCLKCGNCNMFFTPEEIDNEAFIDDRSFEESGEFEEFSPKSTASSSGAFEKK
ncbi:uncharacterized protein LOC131890204 [Tigriopus californicus]|uniref:uncharacterized protein LOC131890204 n=1 Tax=Tigriopus californicus TaxID=6832 RepID=UPI0027DA7C29|nr:uncharacterized protein LOC131890204 [Tigriopus californicus]